MTEFNPNCGKCGMLNSRGFCSLTACRYPSNVIASKPKVIRGMMVNPQIEKPMTNADRIRAMTDAELADFLDRWEMGDVDYSKTFCNLCDGQYDCHDDCLMDWLKSPVEVDDG